MSIYDLIVIGGGSAGLAAATAAAESGVQKILIIERENYLGGVLPQCVHDGFGLHVFGQSLTGPEYAERWKSRISALKIDTALATTVINIKKCVQASPGEASALQKAPGACEITQGQSASNLLEQAKGAGALAKTDAFCVEAVGQALGGHTQLRAEAIIVATGCRERTRGQMLIPGSRPAGIMTAGTAQYMVNILNQLPGNKVVILGSGDIGLIMARRLTLEGAEVRMVLGQEATGLLRNHINCIEEFNIPIRYGWTVVSTHGYGQLKGLSIAPLDAQGQPQLGQKQYIRCNTLLIACGLIPEREVLAGLEQTTQAGLFICGNANQPHDLVDQVSIEGINTGKRAAEYLLSGQQKRLPRQLAKLAKQTIVEQKILASSAKINNLICTECPTSCIIQINPDGSITGNSCERGQGFAQQELIDPKRIFTGTVKVSQKQDIKPEATQKATKKTTQGTKQDRELPLEQTKQGKELLSALNPASETPQETAFWPSLPVLVAVRTEQPVPKSALLKIARVCKRITAQLPIKTGDIIKTNVANTGVNLVATATVGEADAVRLFSSPDVSLSSLAASSLDVPLARPNPLAPPSSLAASSPDVPLSSLAQPNPLASPNPVGTSNPAATPSPLFSTEANQ